jgi:hypothetical protein
MQEGLLTSRRRGLQMNNSYIGQSQYIPVYETAAMQSVCQLA